MKILLINDTREPLRPHLGCLAAMEGVERIIEAAGGTITKRISVHTLRGMWKGSREELMRTLEEDPRTDEWLADVDAVVLNAEGSIHNGQGLELLALLAIAQERNYPTAVLNASFEGFEELIDVLRTAHVVHARERATLRWLAARGVQALHAHDAIVHAKWDPNPDANLANAVRGKVVYTDAHESRAVAFYAAIAQLRARYAESARPVVRAIEFVHVPLEDAQWLGGFADSHVQGACSRTPSSDMVLSNSKSSLQRVSWRSAVATLREAACLITPRHHGLYLGLLAGVPTVCMRANTGKIEGTLEGLPRFGFGARLAVHDADLRSSVFRALFHTNREEMRQFASKLASDPPQNIVSALRNCFGQQGAQLSSSEVASARVHAAARACAPDWARDVVKVAGHRTITIVCAAPRFTPMADALAVALREVGCQAIIADKQTAAGSKVDVLLAIGEASPETSRELGALLSMHKGESFALTAWSGKKLWPWTISCFHGFGISALHKVHERNVLLARRGKGTYKSQPTSFAEAIHNYRLVAFQLGTPPLHRRERHLVAHVATSLHGCKRIGVACLPLEFADSVATALQALGAFELVRVTSIDNQGSPGDRFDGVVLNDVTKLALASVIVMPAGRVSVIVRANQSHEFDEELLSSLVGSVVHPEKLVTIGEQGTVAHEPLTAKTRSNRERNRIATFVKDCVAITPEDAARWIDPTPRAIASVPALAAAHHVTSFAKDYANPWLVPGIVSVETRARDRRLLLSLSIAAATSARAGLAREVQSLSSYNGKHVTDLGAALCVRAYILVADCKQAASAGSVACEKAATAARQCIDELQSYVELAARSSRPHVLRWRVSNLFVLGLLFDALQEYPASLAAFQACAAVDPRPFSPLLGTKTVESMHRLGESAALADNMPLAKEWWLRGAQTSRELVQGDWLNITGPLDASSEGAASEPLAFGMREAAEILLQGTKCVLALRESSRRASQPAIAAELARAETFAQLHADAQRVWQAKLTLESELVRVKVEAKQEITKLLAWNADLQAQKQWHLQTAQQWKDKALELEQMLASHQQWAAQLTKENQWTLAQSAMWQARLEQLEAALNQQQQWINMLTNDKHWLDAQRKTWEDRVTELEGLLSEQQKWSSKLEADVQQLTRDKAWLIDHRAQVEAELERLRGDANAT